MKAQESLAMLCVKAKIVLFSLLFVFVSAQLGAQNYVPNPSFETYSSLPTGYGQITRTIPWYSVNGSCDYFHALSAGANVPNNWFGTQNARTGSAYAGVAFSQSNSYHELIGVQMTTALTIGQDYYFEAYVSAGEGPYMYGINNFGAYFSTTQQSGVPAVTPVVNHTAVISNYTGWTQVSGTFTATVAGSHLSIGNFFSSAATTWQNLGTGGTIASQFWFIEDVLVQPAVILNQGQIQVSASLKDDVTSKVTWTSEDEPFVRYYAIHRSTDGGNTYVDIAKFDVGNGSSGTVFSFDDNPGVSNQKVHYRIKQVMLDGTVQFSDLVEVYMPYPGFSEGTYAFPNPTASSHPVTVSFPMVPGQHEASLYLMDMSGKTLFTENVSSYDNQVNIVIPGYTLPSGIYLAKVVCGNETAVVKVNIQ